MWICEFECDAPFAVQFAGDPVADRGDHLQPAWIPGSRQLPCPEAQLGDRDRVNEAPIGCHRFQRGNGGPRRSMVAGLVAEVVVVAARDVPRNEHSTELRLSQEHAHSIEVTGGLRGRRLDPSAKSGYTFFGDPPCNSAV